MKFDNKTITYLEELSCLSFSDDEKLRLAEDLQKSLNGIEKITGLNTNDVPECIHPWGIHGAVNVFRDDIVIPSFDRELILKNAPVKNDEFFIAPESR